MGRRLNVSTPTVINTELVPLDESFYLDVDGQMEQWYYDNTEQYAPNRKVTPLLLVPVISAFDKDTNTSYTPTFNTTQWFANEWNESQGMYVETEITNQVDSGSADYVIQGNNLLVKKNVSYSHAVSIRCVATYIDPRDRGVTYAVEDSVNLTTNRTADVVFPEVDIISPSGRAYNPLVDDENSQYDFKGVTTNSPVQPLNTDVRRYPVDVDGTEEILNSDEAVAPIMDIRYGENPTMEDQEFMYRQTAGGTLVGESIDKAYIERIKGNTVKWNQVIQNGDFADGVNNWGQIRGTITAQNKICEYTITELGGVSAGNRITQVLVNKVPRHKYIVMYDIDVPRTVMGNTSFNGYSTINQTLTTGKNHVEAILEIPDIEYSNFFFGINTDNYGYSVGDKIYFSNVMAINLTLIYGEGNEPTTVAEFEADYQRWFGKPLTYEEYDEGSLRPVKMTGIKTVGFNAWDASQRVQGKYILPGNGVEVEGASDHSGWVPVIGGQTYYFKNSYGGQWGAFYDENRQFISGKYDFDGIFVVPNNASYVRISLSPSDTDGSIAINLHHSGARDGEYEPYWTSLLNVPVTTLKGKLNGEGSSVVVFPDGLKKAGSIQDEIFVEDGVVKAIKRVESVDLGTLNWNWLSSDLIMATNDLDSFVKKETLAPVVCGLFSSAVVVVSPDMPLNSCALQMNYLTANELCLKVKTSSYSDADTFKSAMQGVMLYYELATPQTYVLDPITDFVWYGIKDGQEVLADTLPWYVSGQGTDNLVVDAMYGENINVVLRCKMMDGETLSPSKAYAALSWRIPDIETFVQSDNGGAVRSSTNNMTFDTIVNVNGEVLTDALKQKHLAFNWKIRKNNTSTEIDKGWGQRITIDASDLRNAKGSGSTLASTLVSNDVYLKGAYEEVTDGGEVVTDGGEVVYDRPVD